MAASVGDAVSSAYENWQQFVKLVEEGRSRSDLLAPLDKINTEKGLPADTKRLVGRLSLKLVGKSDSWQKLVPLITESFKQASPPPLEAGSLSFPSSPPSTPLTASPPSDLSYVKAHLDRSEFDEAAEIVLQTPPEEILYSAIAAHEKGLAFTLILLNKSKSFKNAISWVVAIAFKLPPPLRDTTLGRITDHMLISNKFVEAQEAARAINPNYELIKPFREIIENRKMFTEGRIKALKAQLEAPLALFITFHIYLRQDSITEAEETLRCINSPKLAISAEFRSFVTQELEKARKSASSSSNSSSSASGLTALPNPS